MGNGFEFIDLGVDDPTVVALRVTGKVTADGMVALLERLEGIQQQGRKARLYVDLADYQGYELQVVKEKLTHMRLLWGGIERCAYLVDQQWMKTAIGLVDAVTPMHLRAFAADQSEAARAWLLDTSDV